MKEKKLNLTKSVPYLNSILNFHTQNGWRRTHKHILILVKLSSKLSSRFQAQLQHILPILTTCLFFFTCLTTLATQIELVPPMGRSSRVMAIKRFISRRRRALLTWSDNDSNIYELESVCFLHQKFQKLHSRSISKDWIWSTERTTWRENMGTEILQL